MCMYVKSFNAQKDFIIPYFICFKVNEYFFPNEITGNARFIYKGKKNIRKTIIKKIIAVWSHGTL